ncbi:Fc receptor-like protein 5 isoform X2 [Thunnus maccoyii]|uniref:Fc receptor-like protein 5 isoform X2 n=1 Tax=Thunnus maccoyii TaxID=8240 RepID=UPI001C4A8B8E|nr:Fc receptor-like protein 5 isoform X2 [Thunnus maccoyii]
MILMVNALLLLTAQIQNTSQQADAVFPHVDPNQLQFFEYESISFNCSGFHGPTEWRVMQKRSSFNSQWETAAGSLNIKPVYTSHSGEYWCENEGGERSNTLNITVTDGDMILEIPALPVIEQQAVTLRCRKKTTSSNSLADFYKDGHLIKTDYTGKMNVHNISMSDEGLYKCKISGAGESPESWLAVRGAVLTTNQETTPQEDQEDQEGQESHPPHPGSIQLSILLPVVFTILCVAVLLVLVGLLHFRKHRGSDLVYSEVIYANVTKYKKKRGCQEANVADLHDMMYAVVIAKRKEKDH